MVIKRTGPQNLDFIEPGKTAEQTTAKFDLALKTSPNATSQTGDATDAISRADLSDPQKAEGLLKERLSAVLQESIRDAGVSLSASQKKTLLNVLESDPLVREKLLRHLDQLAK